MFDDFGIEVTNCKDETLDLLNKCIKKDLNYDDISHIEISNIYNSDPECPLARIVYVYVHILTNTKIEKYLSNTLLDPNQNCNERERLWIDSLNTLLESGLRAALPKLSKLVEEFPNDVFAGKFGIFMSLLAGSPQTMLEIANYLKTDPDHFNSPECCSAISFSHIENNDLEEAERYSNRSLEMNPHNAWAQHNLNHIFSARDRFDLAKAALDGHSED